MIIERLEDQAHLDAGPAKNLLQQRNRRLSPSALDRRDRRLWNIAGHGKLTLGQARLGPRLPHQRASRCPTFHTHHDTVFGISLRVAPADRPASESLTASSKACCDTSAPIDVLPDVVVDQNGTSEQLCLDRLGLVALVPSTTEHRPDAYADNYDHSSSGDQKWDSA